MVPVRLNRDDGKGMAMGGRFLEDQSILFQLGGQIMPTTLILPPSRPLSRFLDGTPPL